MTAPSRTYNQGGETYTVRDTGRGYRIVTNTTRGWICRIDWQQHIAQYKRQADRDKNDVLVARMLYDYRADGATPPAPWGRVIKYAGGKQCD